MKKKLLSILLCAMMLCTMMPTLAMAAALPFTDVKTNAWYYNDVKTAYESGLIAGKSATSFDPDANLTYAEAVKLAACMHQKNSIGSISLQKGDPWYQSYVDYCKTNGIISKDYRWNDNATRAGYIEIFAKALPDSSLKAINTVADGSIPDVSMSHPQAASIYKLYRAGIVIGVDTKYNCSPNSNIKRSEVSAILTRMMNANKRLSFTIGEQKTTPPLIITTQPKSVTATEDEQVELSVAVSGGKAPYSYQWQSESQGIWGDLADSADCWASESATLYIKAYKNSWTTNEPLRCIITDSDGNSVTSNSANISIKNEATPLTITSQPKNATAPEGTQAEFSVMVTGGKAPYTFEWYECDPGDTNFSKVVHRAEYYEHYDIVDTASTSALTVKEVGNYYFQQNGIKYRCEITDADGKKVTSNAATLTVIEGPLSITRQPTSITVSNGGQTSFSLMVTGGKAPYTFEWYQCDPGKTNFYPVTYMPEYYEHYGIVDSDRTSALTVKKVGNYYFQQNGIKYRCEITDANGKKVTSNAATLTVI